MDAIRQRNVANAEAAALRSARRPFYFSPKSTDEETRRRWN